MAYKFLPKPQAPTLQSETLAYAVGAVALAEELKYIDEKNPERFRGRASDNRQTLARIHEEVLACMASYEALSDACFRPLSSEHGTQTGRLVPNDGTYERLIGVDKMLAAALGMLLPMIRKTIPSHNPDWTKADDAAVSGQFGGRIGEILSSRQGAASREMIADIQLIADYFREKSERGATERCDALFEQIQTKFLSSQASMVRE